MSLLLSAKESLHSIIRNAFLMIRDPEIYELQSLSRVGSTSKLAPDWLHRHEQPIRGQVSKLTQLLTITQTHKFTLQGTPSAPPSRPSHTCRRKGKELIPVCIVQRFLCKLKIRDNFARKTSLQLIIRIFTLDRKVINCLF